MNLLEITSPIYIFFLFGLSIKHATTFSNIIIKVIYLKNGQNTISVLPMAGNDTPVRLAAHTRWDAPYCPIHISCILQTGRRIRKGLFLQEIFRLCHFLMEKDNSKPTLPKISPRAPEGSQFGLLFFFNCMSGAQFSKGTPLAGRQSKYYGRDSCLYITVKVDELPSPKLPKVPC